MSTQGINRALLVGVEFRSRPSPLPRSAELARKAAELSLVSAENPSYSPDSSPSGFSSLPAEAQPARSQPAEREVQTAVAAKPELSRGTLPDLFASNQTLSGNDFDSAFAEFRELVRSAGAEIVAEMIQRRARPDPATLVGRGKVEEIAALAHSSNASLILFDHNLTPTQMRNLEDALPVRVVDRTQLILDIFARHARTREGQLQVELAQLEYALPRLAGRGAQMSQLGGGIGTRGPGETQLETDRRRIQERLLDLREQIESVRRVRRQQRKRRESVPVPIIALVGYTNAGKSTLFNALTGAGVLASSRMFATLDPKLRSFILPSRRKVLLSDTVGFIRDLPHTLITSFRATLEEVESAELLLHVEDASSPTREQQREEVEKVLGELGVLGKPRIRVLNKIDLLPRGSAVAQAVTGTTTAETLPENGFAARGFDENRGLARRISSGSARLAGENGDVPVSARTGEGISLLIEEIDRTLIADPLLEQSFTVPQQEGGVLAALEAGAVVKERSYSGDRVHLEVLGPASLLGQFRKFRNSLGDSAGPGAPPLAGSSGDLDSGNGSPHPKSQR